MARQRRRTKQHKIETPLTRLVTKMVDDHGGSCIAFAKLAGLTPGQLSRVMSPNRRDVPPGVLTCLRLSCASGVEPWLILEMAGHDRYVHVLRVITSNHAVRQFGSDVVGHGLVTGAELEMIKDYRTLQTNVRASIAFLIQRAAEEREAAARPRRLAQSGG